VGIINARSGWATRVHHLPYDFDELELWELVERFIREQRNYDILNDYYIGRHDILNDPIENDGKPDNRVVANLFKMIVDTSTAYAFGNPITYTSKDEGLLADLKEVLAANNSQDLDRELGRFASHMGHGFEFHYIDEGYHRIKYRSPRNVLAIYSADINERLICAVDVFQVEHAISNQEIGYVDVYREDTITRYMREGEGVYTQVQQERHTFGEVPVVEFMGNDFRMGDAEPIMPLQDAYNRTFSDSVNEVNYQADAYLVLKNMEETEAEDLQNMRRNRSLLLPAEGEAFFLNRNVNDTHEQHVREELVENIHKISAVPNLSDERFATNLSGVAIHAKTQSLEFLTTIKESKFKIAIRKRLRLIFRTLQQQTGRDLEGAENRVEPVFTRNLPSNLAELADISIKTEGTISRHTMRSQIPFIHDLEREAELIEEEMMAKVRLELMRDSALSGGNGDLDLELDEPDTIDDENDGMNDYNRQHQRD